MLVREHWRELGFWRWFWLRRVPGVVRVGVSVALLALVLAGGLFVADRLSAANPSAAATGGYTFQTTVQKLVTVREHGKVVRKLVPVVKRVFLRASTAFETRTSIDTRYVTTPGGVRTVRQRVVKYVPVVKRSVVTVGGKTRTVSVTRLVPTTRVQTQTQTNEVTNVQTVTNTQPTTVVQSRTQTVVVTQTQPVTVTQTQTETRTQTETVVQTVTETSPAVTVTVP